ncbi:NtaA/DmoA family FMN-dependent monooxygenase (plasmid) [Agrobacterium tumefaciens]|uniref:NtaA/DmoA family FMN-dependent monooxygenase n=1 Tax=Agrobacterium TaxID=357 RepID=UPI0012977683|nr:MULTISPECIES: NtaA/DmoA family FMN-dependent monooxygenase [Agrobacterium]MQB13264.1 LLM class flavin-dependent oxidoreductase [Agrobacterium sp. ICMP 6402]NSZ19463.1 NtaA/DmoA family FMN-dependent monooxygenase [Agrobacterium vitis]QZO07165.1 NtaA/DmoA family FMN-dependent monooxygenase [Agrobacterium vitis]UJL91261.1 NtaA/DmoA family FMN-dependent monooxygenase [Agrobacterium vitis]UXT69245.1 NtaA/DmoA family FMN-dependent monooxygenase [Agrobacterium tumefaciens]
MANQHVSLSINFHGVGVHPASWKLVPDRNATWLFQAQLDVARIAHEGVFDALWLPDLPMAITPPEHAPLHISDPQLLMAAIAASVPDIGVVPTVSSSYTEPYTVARNIATLNNISGGRAGVNVIASYHARIAQNYGQQQVAEYAERYRRADEYFNLLGQLIDSFVLTPGWNDPNLLIDPDGRREIAYEGEFFQVRGPLPSPRHASGRPLFSTAGGSEHAIDLAVHHADVLYAALVDRNAAAAFVADIRNRVRLQGRPEGALKVVPGIVPIMGSTTQEAARRLEQLTELLGESPDPVLRVAKLLNIPAADLHPDRPLTEAQLAVPSPDFTRPLGFFRSITDVARSGNLTVRQLGQEFQLGGGHKIVVGTPDTVASTISDWYRSGAADGFVLHLQDLPRDARDFVDHVIPLLRREGIYPDGYAPGSLRQRLGIPETNILGSTGPEATAA